MRLNEIANYRNPMTLQFLNLWTQGSTSAKRYLTPSVRSDLKRSVTEESYQAYRGYKFDEDGYNINGVSANELVGINMGYFKDDLISHLPSGTQIQIDCSMPTSWSLDKNAAELFARPDYDSITGEDYTDEEIEDMGYSRGDVLGIGILVGALIPKQYVLADITNRSHNNEQEIIVEGNIAARILKINRVVFAPKEEEIEHYTEPTMTPEWEARIRAAVIRDLAKHENK